MAFEANGKNETFAVIPLQPLSLRLLSDVNVMLKLSIIGISFKLSKC